MSQPKSNILFLDSDENRCREINRRLSGVVCLSTSESAITSYELGAKYDVVCINIWDCAEFVLWILDNMPVIKRIYLFLPETESPDILLAARTELSAVGYTTICMPFENLLTFVNV